jgi:Fe2+ or Zn2+ uptake regulation protein
LDVPCEKLESLAVTTPRSRSKVTAARGAERFELVRGNEHAHHLHCDRYGRVTTAPVCGVDVAALCARILRDYGFAVADHTLTFHGRCAECRGAVH